jgi:hypothetical protein
MAAVLYAGADCLKLLLARGADVNARAGPYRRSALMTAVASEQAGAATVKLLLEKGVADPNAEDLDGERTLDWALYRADQAKIAVLAQAGATRGHGPRQKIFPPPEAGGIRDPRVSLGPAVSLMLPTTPVAYQKRGCISCHSQALVAMAAAVVRAKGIVVNEEMAATNLKQILAAYAPAAEQAMQGDQPAGNIITIGYVMMALAAEKISGRQNSGRARPTSRLRRNCRTGVGRPTVCRVPRWKTAW